MRAGNNGTTSFKLCSTVTNYDVSDDGRLYCEGRLTAWDISDLSDTGRTFDPLTAWF